MASKDRVPAVVTTEWLAERLEQPKIKVLDVSWYLPPMGRSAVEEFKAARIPGAQFWDVDGVADPKSDLPHMLPSEDAFAAAADALGISNDETVVLYDGMGMFAAPRAWWTWRVFGHDKVAVLEGGLPAWKSHGQKVDESPVEESELTKATAAARAKRTGETEYRAKLAVEKVRNLAQMKTLVTIAEAAAGQDADDDPPPLMEQVVDARPAGRFKGVDPEPRPGLRLGHMPGANNVPFPLVYEGGEMQGAKLKPKEQLAAVFKEAGVDVSKPLVCSCGSGLTACILALAVYQVNGTLVPIYDGSWCEWGAQEDTSIVTGE